MRTWMRSIIWKATSLVALLVASHAYAAEWQDCAKGDVEHRIAGCSQVISQLLGTGQGGETRLKNAYVLRGSQYLAKGEFDLAIADQNAAIEIDPNYAIAFSLRGNAHSKKGEHDRAIADFSEAIRRDPGLMAAYSSRGYTYAAKGARDLAQSDFRKVLELPATIDANKRLQDQEIARSGPRRACKACAARRARPRS
jgi:tetratricopeptide (TPR) repeat protein